MGFLRRRWGWLLLALGVIAAGLIARGRAAGPQVPVVVAARRDLVQKVVVSGRVMAPARISVGSMLSGTVAVVGPEEGTPVKAGDLLVQLDDQELTAALSQARAGVEQAQAKLAQLKQVGARLALEGYRQAQVASDQAEKRRARLESLSRAGSATQAELEDAQSAHELAKSKVAGADAQAKSMQSGGSEFRLATAALSQAVAAQAAAEARLAQTHLVAPVDAVVLIRKVEPGDAVQPGRPLLVLARSGATFLSVQPDEKNLALLQAGQEALASTDAFPGETFPARVSTVAPSIDAERGTVEVKLAVPTPPAYLRPDMTVSVEVEVARRSQVVVVASEAVRDIPARKPWVMLVKDGRTERREVKLGIIGDGLVEIASGLSPGEQVVPLTPAPLQPGQRVRPLPAPGS
ncbi:MAG: efflux RND transporter periplasmic adaptor subunit [Myxococcaceae bacterium]